MTDKSTWSTAAQRFAPGNFVETWNPDLGRMAIGITRAIKDPFEANPLVLVRWLHDFSQEGVRAVYLRVLNAGG